MKIRLWWMILWSLLCTASVSGQNMLQGFDGYVEKAVREWNVPGLAVAVVKDGKVIFQKGYGVQSVDSPAPVDENTRFAIGSTTKAMTAMAVGMLVGEGKLKWDDPVIDHLPDFRLHDPWVTREVTVRELLTHSAGLGNADFLWYGQENTTAEIIQRLRYLEPRYSMRAGFVYQNIMYGTAGELIARISGQSWESFLQTRLFDRLGMKETLPRLGQAASEKNMAQPHDEVDGRIVQISNAPVDAIPAAGATWSSVSDMSRWIRFLLNEGVAEDGTRLVDEKIIQEVFSPQVMVPRDEFYPTRQLTKPHWTTYGLAWFQHDYQGRKVDFHTGSIDGMVAIVGLIRDEELGVVVLSNRSGSNLRHALMYRVFDLFGKEPARDWSAELRSLYGGLEKEGEERRHKSEQERVADTAPSLPLEAYAGTYSSPLFGKVIVSQRQGGLHFQYGPGLQGPMEHWHYDTFRVNWEARWRGSNLATFLLDSEGKPTRLQMGNSEFKRQTGDSSK